MGREPVGVGCVVQEANAMIPHLIAIYLYLRAIITGVAQDFWCHSFYIHVGPKPGKER